MTGTDYSRARTTTEEAAGLLASARQSLPDLNCSGIKAIHEARSLDDYLDQIALCADWIRQLQFRVTGPGSQPATGRHCIPGRRTSSYAYKHVVERWAEEYISNGSFIAAAVGLGFPFTRFPEGGPNLLFDFTRSSLRMRPEDER